MGSLQLSDNDVAQLWSELESEHRMQARGSAAVGAVSLLPTLEEGDEALPQDLSSFGEDRTQGQDQDQGQGQGQGDSMSMSIGLGSSTAVAGQTNSDHGYFETMRKHNNTNVNDGGNTNAHTFSRSISFPMSNSSITTNSRNNNNHLQKHDHPMHQTGDTGYTTLKMHLDRANSLPSVMSSNHHHHLHSSSSNGMENNDPGSIVSRNQRQGNANRITDSSLFDPVEVNESFVFESRSRERMSSNVASTPADLQEMLSRGKDGYHERYDLSTLDDSFSSNNYARRVTINDMSVPLSRQSQLQYRSGIDSYLRNNDHEGSSMQKASSAPVLGKSTFSSTFGFDRASGSSKANMGNSVWNAETFGSSNNFDNLRNISMGGLDGGEIPRTNSDFLSGSNSRMARVQSESGAMWGALNSRQQNRNSQRKTNFLSLNRPIKEQQNHQFCSMDGTNALHSRIPTTPRCDYVDFSMIDDSKVTDETPIYGQTYESILRNPDVLIVQNADVVVVPGTKNTRIVPTFPKRLMVMLCRSDISNIISWLPHGRSFIVRDPKKFEEDLYPRFFKPAKYKSFQRQLNLWKFIRINKGFDSGSYYHPLFLRGKPQLVKKMILPKNEDTDRRSTNPNKIEPDFYALAKVRPLPELSPTTTTLPPKYSAENSNAVLTDNGLKGMEMAESDLQNM